MASKASIRVTSNVNREEFSRFVYKNANTSVFQTLEMSEVYKSDKGCMPLILVAINEDSGKIVASLLAKILEERPGFLSSFSRHSTIRGGPIFEDNPEGTTALSLLLRHYNEIIKKDALYSRVYPLNDAPQVIPFLKKNGYEYGGWQNFLVNLDRPIDEIWKQLKKSRRYGINKAKKKGIIIEEIREKELIPVFYNLLQETYKERNNPLEDISNFEAAFDILVPKKMAKFLMAKHEGRYISAVLILLYKKVVYYWYLGSSKKQDDLVLCPNDLITWHAIEWCSKNGFHTFDFGGGGLPGDTAGWVEFKRQFGGKLVNFGRYTKVHQPKKLWFSLKMFEVYKRLL